MTVSGDMPDFTAFADAMPFLRYRLLAKVGLRAAQALYSGVLDEYLQSRSFSSAGLPKYGHRRGGYYSINKAADAVRIGSFPMDVYHAGPGPRTAKRTIGKRVFRSFKSSFNVNAEAVKALSEILDEE